MATPETRCRTQAHIPSRPRYSVPRRCILCPSPLDLRAETRPGSGPGPHRLYHRVTGRGWKQTPAQRRFWAGPGLVVWFGLHHVIRGRRAARRGPLDAGDRAAPRPLRRDLAGHRGCRGPPPGRRAAPPAGPARPGRPRAVGPLDRVAVETRAAASLDHAGLVGLEDVVVEDGV